MTLPTPNAADNTSPAPAETAAAPASGLKSLGAVPNFGPTRAPRPQRFRPRTRLLILAAVLVAVIGCGVAYGVMRSPRTARADLVTHKVRYDRLELTIVERGALESANNNDIYCRVKAGARGGTTSGIIKWVVDDGSLVKKDEVVVELDDSGLQDQLKNQKITVDKAEADKIKAEEDYNITLSQNESDIKTAEVNLQLAKIDLQKYQEGDYPQQLKIFEGNIKQAESDVEQQRDRVAWANRMVKKGYLTVTQAQGEQSKLESLQITLAKAQEDRRVLTDPTFGTAKRQITFLQNDVQEKQRALERVKSQAKAKEAQARSAREALKSVHQQGLSQYKEIDDEIKKCKITAPQDGMVVYYIPEQARGGSGSQQSIVAQGEPVREGQKLMQIPDLHRMLVNTKVHEALVSKVRAGQSAVVRIDSLPDRVLAAHVEQVATVSSSQDFFSADVKVYTTKVMIDETLDGLKPGMSAEVTITVADALEHVLTVPIQAIVGSVEMGEKRKCFVMTPEGPQEREIVVGQSNVKIAEIKEGLQEGDEVVLNPKTLLGDQPSTRSGGASKGGKSAAKGAAEKKSAAPPAQEKSKGAAPGSGSMSPEDRQKMLEKYRQASPEQRKQMLEQVPEAFRDKVRERLKEQGIEIN